MAVIKSGATSDQLTIDPTSKAGRATIYNSGGTELSTRNNPVVTTRAVTPGTLVGKYMSTTYRIVGSASTNINVFWIGNPTGSNIKVGVRRISIQFDHTTLLATTSNVICSHFAGTPTGGVTAALSSKLAATYSNASALTLQLASSEGTNGTAISATPGSRVWSQWVNRPHTLVGWFPQDDCALIPALCESDPIILAENDGLLITYVQALTTGAFMIINCVWEEYTP